MVNKVQKYVFVGDCNSINLEIIYKGFSYLKNKLEYILIGDIDDLKSYAYKQFYFRLKKLPIITKSFLSLFSFR